MNLRTMVIWGVIVVVLIGLYSMMAGGGRANSQQEITYSQLLSRVNAGEVKSAEIRGAYVEATGQDNRKYTAITPNNQDDLVQRLEKQGADIKVKAPGGFTLVGFLLHRDWEDPHAWFCSEIVPWAIHQSGHALFRPSVMRRVTPQHLWMVSREP